MLTPMFILSKKILIIASLFPLTSFAGMITGTGAHELSLKENISLACSVAESKAINSALEKYSSKNFIVNKNNYCYDVKNYAYCNYYVEKNIYTSGTIKKILDKKETIGNGICKVDIKLLVEESKYLDVNVSGKSIYFVGEPLDYTVQANEDLFLYVFNIHKKGTTLLFPNSYSDNNLVNSDYIFPGNGKKYINYLHDGVNQDEETILFLFTKHHVEFDKNTLTKNTLYEIINSIPVHSKRTFTNQIFIKRK